MTEHGGASILPLPTCSGSQRRGDRDLRPHSEAGPAAQQPMRRAARPRPLAPEVTGEGLASIPEGGQLGSSTRENAEGNTGTDSRDVTPLYIPGVRDHTVVDDGAIARMLLRKTRHDAGLRLRVPYCKEEHAKDVGSVSGRSVSSNELETQDTDQSAQLRLRMALSRR
mmetsp:Transcript_99211/g.305866  ORF Transcript_99211/g.305866 Transcript_99211/m.305866 type:complete len:168 (-) Transcript_99211:91-594(-)